MMIRLQQVTKRFGGRTVLDGVTFDVANGDVVGIVGPNGCGKTTLLDIVAGVRTPDSGHVALPRGQVVGYLRQGYADALALPASQVFPHAFALASAERRLATLAGEVAAAGDRPEGDRVPREYAEAIEDLLGANEGFVRAAWEALSLRAVEPDEALGALSGGELTKLGLVDLVAARPAALLLDEPTNNLDLPALSWLDEYLDAFAGPVLVVSHDRELLDRHARRVIEIDPLTGRAVAFAGDYSAYAEEKARRRADEWERYRRQRRRERHVQQELRDIKATAQRRERRSQNDFYRRKAKKVARRALVLERRLERELQSQEHVAKPAHEPYRLQGRIDAPRSGERMLVAEGLTVQAGPRVLLRDVDLAIGWGDRIVLVGANGSGKTTLVRVLAGEAAPAAGAVRRSPSARVGYMPQAEGDGVVDRAAASPVDLVRAAAPLSETEARRFLHRFLFTGDDALTPVERLSYGERRRLHLARLVLAGANLLLLDEPTNHLDIPSREAFEAALDSYDGSILAVTHDRYFAQRFAGRMLAIEGDHVREAL